MNGPRPVIKVKSSQVDVLIDRLSLVGLILLCVYTIMNYAQLPDTIPTHYNMKGQVDGYGGKATIVILPSILIVMHIGLTVLNHYPHLFNYPTIITEENAERQYILGTRLIRYLKLIMVITFFFIIVSINKDAYNAGSSLGSWFVPVFSVVMFLPAIIFFIKSKGPKRQTNNIHQPSNSNSNEHLH